MAQRPVQQRLWEDPPEADAGGGAERKARLSAALENQILAGLSAEWHQAVWLLPEPIRQQLRPPLFAIDDAERRLGAWRRDRREISLSRRLVTNARWDDIREVLLHEMAHQVAHEGLAAIDEPGHGESFRQACRWLRANPAASGSHRPLHARLVQGEPQDARDRIMVRVHKLMALAASNNPNEAHAAMAKAHELIARYNIDRIERGQKETYISIFLGQPRLRQARQAYHLAHLLQDFYFVQGMWVQAWVLDKERMGRVLEISGSARNVRIAEHVYHVVNRYIDDCWEQYRRHSRLTGHRKTDFAVGIVHGFRTTLTQASQACAPAETLPVSVQDPALTRYIARRYPHVRSFSRRANNHDVQVLADGSEQGKKLVIAKGIEEKDGFRQRMIEN